MSGAEEQIESLIDRATDLMHADVLHGDLAPAIKTLRNISGMRPALAGSEYADDYEDWIETLEELLPIAEWASAAGSEQILADGRRWVDEAKKQWNNPGKPRKIAFLLMERIVGNMALEKAKSSKLQDRQEALSLCDEAHSYVQWWQADSDLNELAELAVKLAEELDG